MHGDSCEVMLNMVGGNMVCTSSMESLSPSSNNFNFFPNMPFQYPFPSTFIPKEENGMLIIGGGKEEMMERGSGSGSQLQMDQDIKSVDELENITSLEPDQLLLLQEQEQQPPKKKRHHRHTAHQIQELEEMFKECPHPDDKQRMRLSEELGLKPRQVKFWFQNRRTQIKAQQDRSENVVLRAENAALRNENYQLRAQLRSLACHTCGGPATLGGISFEDLRVENARLREELERICCFATRDNVRTIDTMGPNKPLDPPPLDLDMSIYSKELLTDAIAAYSESIPIPMLPSETSSFMEATFGPVILDEEKPLAMEIAMSSVDEIVKMCFAKDPLWIKNNESGKEMLNGEERTGLFPRPSNTKQFSSEFVSENTRDSAVVIMKSLTLVDTFLDPNKWTELFPSIVARARTIQVIRPGVSGANGALQLMHAEFQFLSPLVPAREAYFLRFCQHNAEEGTWVVVDSPIDSFTHKIHHYSPFPLYRRHSGCVIKDMPNGYTRVTWVEQAEIEEKHKIHHIFGQLVHSGAAFGAQRWLAVLQRQCERVASLMARNISDLGVIPSLQARKNLMRLSQRMMRTFCLNISACNRQSWTSVLEPLDDTFRTTTRKVTEPGQPNGVILCAVSTTWLPYDHHQVFNLLRDEQRRSQLGVLSNGNVLHEIAHVANGSDPGNSMSLLRVNAPSNASHHIELMLQESSTDQSGSLVVYSSIDVDSVQLAMSGDDPSCIPILPVGFVIIPTESQASIDLDTNKISSNDPSEGNSSSMSYSKDIGDSKSNNASLGCLLTVGLQVLASTVPSEKISLSSINALNNHLCNTVHQIRAALTISNSPTPTSSLQFSSNGNMVGHCVEPSAPPTYETLV